MVETPMMYLWTTRRISTDISSKVFSEEIPEIPTVNGGFSDMASESTLIP